MDATRLPTPRPTVDSSQRLADEITTLSACLNAATCRLLDLIRKFDEGRHWERLGMHSCAHWLNFKCGIGMNAAREKLRVAHALKHLPAIHAAFSRGELSYSKVRAMTRVANAANEDYLMNIARHGTAYHVERLVSSFRRCKRLEDSAQAERQYAARQVSVYYDDVGSLVLKGRFPPDMGAMIVKSLEKGVEDAFQAAGDVSAETSSDTARLPIAARRADALAALAESYLNAGPRSASTADRYQVVVHASADTLRAANAADEAGVSAETSCAPGGGNGTDVSAVTSCAHGIEGRADVSAETQPWINADLSQLEDGRGVSAETSRRLACDASIVGIADGADGEPLSIGRKSRSVPPAMRRALKARDGGCRFPGCTHRHFIDAHHVRHWADGGETCLDNLLQLCRYHHRLVHEGGFGCERREDGSVVFTDRNGRPLDDYCDPVPLEDEADVNRWLDALTFELDIDKDTCKTRWYAGDRMDWDLGVAHMFQCELSCSAADRPGAGSRSEHSIRESG